MALGRLPWPRLPDRGFDTVASAIVPTMILVYMAGGLLVLAINWRGIPDIFTFVIQDAFTPTAAMGGFARETRDYFARGGVDAVGSGEPG